MKPSSTLFLQIVIVLIGIAALAVLLIEPHYEGRNQHATVYQVYFNDPFLVYAYTGSIFFFIALRQAFGLLSRIGRNQVFTPESVRALRIIKWCALALAGFLLGAEAFFFLVQRGSGEDIAGGVALGLVMIFLSTVIAAAADVFQRLLQNAADLKSKTT